MLAAASPDAAQSKTHKGNPGPLIRLLFPGLPWYRCRSTIFNSYVEPQTRIPNGRRVALFQKQMTSHIALQANT